MKFLDINTFFNYKAGGIRTYHQAKIEFFKQNKFHDYCLLYPGPEHNIAEIGENIRLIQRKGLALTKDAEGYRLMLNPFSISRAIKSEGADVIEIGDPWLSALFTLFNPALKGKIKTSMYHSDPIDTYLYPWVKKSGVEKWMMPVAKLAEALFYKLQKQYHGTVVASQIIEKKLLRQGVEHVHFNSFGIQKNILYSKDQLQKKWRTWQSGPLKILYAGRLDKDKGTGLIVETLEKICRIPNVKFTMVGRGKLASHFKNVSIPNFTYGGYVSEPSELQKIYHEHQVLLAPGPYETFGLGALEAMASGLVVVGPDAGGVGELLSKLNSPLRFKAGDKNSFLSVVENLRNENLEKLAQKSHALAEDYGDWDNFFNRQIQFYQSLFKNGDL